MTKWKVVSAGRKRKKTVRLSKHSFHLSRPLDEFLGHPSHLQLLFNAPGWAIRATDSDAPNAYRIYRHDGSSTVSSARLKAALNVQTGAEYSFEMTEDGGGKIVIFTPITEA